MTHPTDDQIEERETAALLAQLKASPSPEARARAYARLQEEFHALPAQDSARRRALPRWAIAAGVAAMALAGAFWTTMTPVIEVAQVEELDGVIDVSGARWFERTARLASGATVSAGQSLVVAADGGALLRFSPDLTVRLAPGAHARVVSREEVALDLGEAFVDATPGAVTPLRIVTPHGAVTHLGTQYLVRSGPNDVELAVREGRARLQAFGITSVAEAGHWVLARDGAAPSSGTLAPDDARFAWIAALPSNFKLEGATLGEFLAWFRRESGLLPVYSTGLDAGHFDRVQLSGSIDHLAPLEALSIVLATADLTWHREDAKVIIEKRPVGTS